MAPADRVEAVAERELRRAGSCPPPQRPHQGAFRVGDYEEIMSQTSALAWLSNAVLVWNTVRIDEIIGAQEDTCAQPVPRKHVARISPLANVVPSGTYHFERAATGGPVAGPSAQGLGARRYT